MFVAVDILAQALDVAENLRISQRNDTSWADHRFLERQKFLAKVELTVAFGAFRLLAFVVVSGHACEEKAGLKRVELICLAYSANRSIAVIVVGWSALTG